MMAWELVRRVINGSKVYFKDLDGLSSATFSWLIVLFQTQQVLRWISFLGVPNNYFLSSSLLLSFLFFYLAPREILRICWGILFEKRWPCLRIGLEGGSWNGGDGLSAMDNLAGEALIFFSVRWRRVFDNVGSLVESFRSAVERNSVYFAFFLSCCVREPRRRACLRNLRGADDAAVLRSTTGLQWFLSNGNWSVWFPNGNYSSHLFPVIIIAIRWRIPCWRSNIVIAARLTADFFSFCLRMELMNGLSKELFFRLFFSICAHLHFFLLPEWVNWSVWLPRRLLQP